MAGAIFVMNASILPPMWYVPDVMNIDPTGSIETWVPAAISSNVPVV